MYKAARQPQLSVAGRSAANPLAAVAAFDRWDRQTDGRTDTRALIYSVRRIEQERCAVQCASWCTVRVRWHDAHLPITWRSVNSRCSSPNYRNSTADNGSYDPIILILILLHSFNGLFSGTTSISGYQKVKTSLDLNEARDGGVLGCSGISWGMCHVNAA